MIKCDNMNKKLLAIIIIGIFSMSVIPIDVLSTHVRNKTITFSSTNAIDGNWIFADNSIAGQARFFGGDASPSLWLHGNVLSDNFVLNGIDVNNLGQGEMIQVITNNVVQSSPNSLQKLVDDMSFNCGNNQTFICLDAMTNFSIDPYIFVTLNNCDPSNLQNLQIKTASTVRMRIVNPEDIVSITSLQFKIEQGMGIYDGLNKIENKDNYRTRTIAFTNTNKTQGVQFTFASDTLTFDGTGTLHPSRVDDFSKNYIKLNVGLDEFIKLTQSNFTYTTGKNLRIKFDVFYDDIQVLNSQWGINQAQSGIDTTIDPDPKGTCENPTEEGINEFNQLFRLRSHWNFDTKITDPINNLDGYEGWKWSSGAEVSTNANETVAGTGGRTGTWLVTRETDYFNTPPKSIKEKFSMVGGNFASGCFEPSDVVISNLWKDERIMKQNLTNPNVDEPFVFRLFYFARMETTSTGSDTCTPKVTIDVIAKTTNGAVIETKTKVITLSAIGGTGSANPQVTQSAFNGKMIELVFIFGNQTSSEARLNIVVQSKWDFVASTVGGNNHRFYSLNLDTFGSTWKTLGISEGGGGDPTDTCIVFPELCDIFDGDGDGGGGGGGSEPPIIIGGDPVTGEGGLELECGTGILDFSPIDVNDTDSAVQTSSQWLTNVFTIIGCGTSLLIPLGTLFFGIGVIVAGAGTLKDAIKDVIFVWIIVWAIMFSLVFQFFPFWVGLLIPIAVVGIWIMIAKRTTG